MGPSVHSKNTTQSFFLRITPNRVSGNGVADGRASISVLQDKSSPCEQCTIQRKKTFGQCSLSGMKAALAVFVQSKHWTKDSYALSPSIVM